MHQVQREIRRIESAIRSLTAAYRDLQSRTAGDKDLVKKIRSSLQNREVNPFKGANLRGVNLEGETLEIADLSGADLRKAKFNRSNFDGSKFVGANLEGANFGGTSLRGSVFKGAKLKGASFFYADLRWADVRGTDLRQADVSLANTANIVWDSSTLWPDGFTPESEMKVVKPDLVSMAKELSTRLEKEGSRIFPYIRGEISLLGGKSRPYVVLTVSTQPQKDWPNKILENSDYAKIGFILDGQKNVFHAEQLGGYNLPKMRKVKFTDIDSAVNQFLRWAQKAR